MSERRRRLRVRARVAKTALPARADESETATQRLGNHAAGIDRWKRPEPGEIESYPAEATWLHCSFEGLDEHEAEHALGGFLYCLCDLADYLADNISFGELFSTKRDELEKAFGGLDKLSRVKRAVSLFLASC